MSDFPHLSNSWGKVNWDVISMFSGIECFREAMLMLESAMVERFGVKVNHEYQLMETLQQLYSFHSNILMSSPLPTSLFYYAPFVSLISQSLGFQPQVEKNRICRTLLADHFPDTCLASDVFHLLNTRPRAKTWSPRKLELAKYFWCETHKKEFLDNFRMDQYYNPEKVYTKGWYGKIC